MFLALATAGSQAAQPGAAGPSMLSALLPFIAVFVIFYLLIILPQRKKQKKHQEMVNNLKSGDRVVTSGGMFGTVMGVKPDRIELKIASNTVIEVTKSAVAIILDQSVQTKTS